MTFCVFAGFFFLFFFDASRLTRQYLLFHHQTFFCSASHCFHVELCSHLKSCDSLLVSTALMPSVCVVSWWKCPRQRRLQTFCFSLLLFSIEEHWACSWVTRPDMRCRFQVTFKTFRRLKCFPPNSLPLFPWAKWWTGCRVLKGDLICVKECFLLAESKRMFCSPVVGFKCYI